MQIALHALSANGCHWLMTTFAQCQLNGGCFWRLILFKALKIIDASPVARISDAEFDRRSATCQRLAAGSGDQPRSSVCGWWVMGEWGNAGLTVAKRHDDNLVSHSKVAIAFYVCRGSILLESWLNIQSWDCEWSLNGQFAQRRTVTFHTCVKSEWCHAGWGRPMGAA